MPAARNQEVTVRRPLAKRAPTRSSGRRAAERRSSQWARPRKALATKAGRCDNDMGRPLGAMGRVGKPIVARGPAFVYPSDVTRRRAGSAASRWHESRNKSRKVQMIGVRARVIPERDRWVDILDEFRQCRRPSIAHPQLLTMNPVICHEEKPIVNSSQVT